MTHPRPSLAVALLGAAWLAAAPTAQTDALLLSTSSNTTLAGAPVGDEDLLAQVPGQPARLALPAAAWAALEGDLDDNGLHWLPGDVDAVHHEAGGATIDAGLYLSTVSDENGVRDGDVLHATASGFEVAYGEDAFIAATGASDGNVDIDAFHREPDGRVLFSFAEDEDSSLLSGDVPGVLGDGDVLAWWPATGAASVLYTEDQISALVGQALGQTVASGDTKGLSRDVQTGALLFCVQSPSDHDASVFSDAGGGALVAGRTEADLGFETNAELDALAATDASWPSLTVSDPRPAAGDTLELRVEGAPPGALAVLLPAIDLAPVWLPTSGWGGLVLSIDAAFDVGLAALPSLTVVADVDGRASLDVPIPTPMPELDLVWQAVVLVPRVTTNPVLVELAQ